MYKYLRGQKEVTEDCGTSSQKDLQTEELDLSKLLNFETIKAKTFYQIRKEVSQLSKEKPETEEKIIELKKKYAETMNLLGEANLEAQQKAWEKIVERYSREVDEDAFNASVKGLKKDIAWELKLTRMQAGLNLAMLGIEKGFEILKDAGIVADDYDTALRKVKGIITNYELKNNNNQIDDKESPDFYETWALIIKAGYNIDDDIKLPAWCGVIKSIRKENDGRRRNNIKN